MWLRPILTLSLLVGCRHDLPPEGSYYEERIEPTLRESCTITTSGCHLATVQGSAMGNLDLSSYDSLRRRTDVLLTYGPYPRPLLLLKASGPVDVTVDTLDGPVSITTDIRHGGATNILEGSRAFNELTRWIQSGFQRTGVPAETSFDNSGGCVPGVGTAPGFSAGREPANPDLFDRFVSEVQPILVERCGGASCHGAGLADFHIACGDDEAERRWNYWITLQHVGEDPAASELLVKPLAPSRGGAFHGGGSTFETTDDSGYSDLLGWAETVVSSAPELVREQDVSEGYRFFVNRVQPILVRKGCMALACHSPVSVAFTLRGGAGGTFSRFARQLNYRLARKKLALESSDPNQSRLIAKNLFSQDAHPEGDGILHRGGPLFEDFFGEAASPEDCVGIDADNGDLNEIPAYCVLARWHEIERAAAALEPLHTLVWVARPPGIGPITDFDTYRRGADLRMADASLAADGSVTVGASRSVLAGCGLDSASADVRRPRASWDGTELAFAARSSDRAPLRIYRMNADGTGCSPIDGLAAGVDEAGGILVHDFDPAYAPNGHIVFASTRGTSYGRPTRTRSALEPNADIYVYEPDAGTVRQLTFLLDQEVAPAFMQDGRVIYTAEKRALDFHMFALRRQNLDGGDYHPLLAQRHSIGFGEANDVAPLPDGNFVFVAALLSSNEGAGSIAVFNRTLGPDQEDRDPGDRAYLHSLSLPARGAPHGGAGLYRSPAVLPNGRVIVSCAPGVTDPAATAVDFDLCELHPRTGAMTTVVAEPGVALLDAVALYARPNRGVLVSDGGGIDRPLIVADATDAEVHFNDFPMIQTLMFSNTRIGRPIDYRIGGFELLRIMPPPEGTTSFADLGADVVSDSYGQFFGRSERMGWAPLFEDGSVRIRVPGGIAVSYRMTDSSGVVLDMPEGFDLTGPDVQREQEQYYPGERIQRSIPRRFFNTVCGACHGSISGRELDVVVDLDVISSASLNAARDASAIDMFGP